MTNLVNGESIAKCLEYVDTGKEIFKEIANSLTVRTKLIDRTQNYFGDNDEMVRNVYLVSVTRNKKNISFKFGDSQNNTMEGIEPQLYDIMTVIGSEYDLNNYDYEEFCDEFGYDQELRATEKLFNKWKRHNEKLKQIFSDEEIEVFPH